VLLGLRRRGLVGEVVIADDPIAGAEGITNPAVPSVRISSRRSSIEPAKPGPKTVTQRVGASASSRAPRTSAPLLTRLLAGEQLEVDLTGSASPVARAVHHPARQELLVGGHLGRVEYRSDGGARTRQSFESIR